MSRLFNDNIGGLDLFTQSSSAFYRKTLDERRQLLNQPLGFDLVAPRPQLTTFLNSTTLLDGRLHSIEATLAFCLLLDKMYGDLELLQNDVEITGVEEQKSEGLSHVVFTLANKLGVKLEQQNVVSAVRIGRMESGGGTGRPRPIVGRCRICFVRHVFDVELPLRELVCRALRVASISTNV
ncbi:hypothetical protein ACJJTC_019249 [Scirpophaga incertulas]